MKVLRSFVLALGLLFVVSAAHAQSGAVAARVPFDFVVGSEVYPAGNYLLSSWGAARGSILIQSRDKLRYRMVPVLLEQVWLQGNTFGRQFFKTNIETQLA